MRLPRPRTRRQTESTIALINVVFLMLIFFLIAGSLAPSQDAGVALIETRLTEQTAPADALFATAEGELRNKGTTVTAQAFLASLDDGQAVRVAADRDLPAGDLVGIIGELQAAGAEEIRLVTERARQP